MDDTMILLFRFITELNYKPGKYFKIMSYLFFKLSTFYNAQVSLNYCDHNQPFHYDSIKYCLMLKPIVIII